MGVIFDYFIAASDNDAAATIDRVGGPGLAVPAQRGLFGRRKTPDLPALDSVLAAGIDPVVQAGTLEALLTDRPYDDLESDPQWSLILAERNGGEQLVVRVTDSLVNALAQADPDRLSSVATPWSQTEEFWGQARPEDLAAVLHRLARLAQKARAQGQAMFCWVCV
jgi:hypothetical protein